MSDLLEVLENEWIVDPSATMGFRNWLARRFIQKDNLIAEQAAELARFDAQIKGMERQLYLHGHTASGGGDRYPRYPPRYR
jgi:hypothetical protein